MKKAILLFLAVMMVMGLSVTSFASKGSMEPNFPVGIGTRTIFGNDTAYTYTDVAVAKLVITYGNGTVQHGTGFMYGTNVMGTAGHVIYHPTYGLAETIEVYLATSSSSTSPDATIDVSLDSNCFIPDEWANDRSDWRYDYGAIKFTNNISQYHFGLRQTVSVNQQVAITGYRGNEWSSKRADGPIIGMSSNTSRPNAPDDLQYRMDTLGGVSGAPVYDSEYYAVGINNYGANSTEDNLEDDAPSSMFNSAARIHKDCFNFLYDVKY